MVIYGMQRVMGLVRSRNRMYILEEIVPGHTGEGRTQGEHLLRQYPAFGSFSWYCARLQSQRCQPHPLPTIVCLTGIALQVCFLVFFSLPLSLFQKSKTAEHLPSTK